MSTHPTSVNSTLRHNLFILPHPSFGSALQRVRFHILYSATSLACSCHIRQKTWDLNFKLSALRSGGPTVDVNTTAASTMTPSAQESPTGTMSPFTSSPTTTLSAIDDASVSRVHECMFASPNFVQSGLVRVRFRAGGIRNESR